MLTKGQAIIMAHGAISKALPSEWPDVHLMMSSSDLVRFAELAIADFLERTGQYVTNDASRESVIAEAVAKEREACAGVVEAERIGFAHDDEQLNRISSAIRARGEKGWV